MQIEVLGERYKLQDPIGRGGMATIYRGHDMRMDRVVAIKVLREAYSTDPKFVIRFQREAKAASSLQHPNIVQVYDYGHSDGNYFIVMELIEGTDLRRYLRSRGLLAIDRAIIIAHDVALGLGAAHRRGIVHRDVKPQNVLVSRDGSIKLTDFGIASVYKDINAERLTTTGMTLGTVQYYAPEQAQGEIVNPAADVYALGIVMYEMLTGRTPFDGDTPVAVAMQHIQDIPLPPSQLNPGIPPALEEIILRCLEKVPEMRYRDGSSLARALELLSEGELVETITGPSGTGLPPASGNYTYNQAAQQKSGKTVATANGNTPPSASSAIEDAATQHQTYLNLSSNGQSSIGGPQNVQPYSAPAEAGVTRPFHNGAHSGRVQDPQESRFASIITIMILLATLLLLGFSVYLATELNFLHVPGANVIATATPNDSQGIKVPDLINMDYVKAGHVAAAAHFTLSVNNHRTSGIVSNQFPQAGASAAPNSAIQVDLASPEVTPTVTLPNDLIGKSLVIVEQELNALNIPYNTTPHDAGPDPTKGSNIVVRIDPPGNSSLTKNAIVQLYVANFTNGAPNTLPSPTVAPQPTATPKPQPTATPKPQPTATPVPPPPPSPTATPTPILPLT